MLADIGDTRIFCEIVGQVVAGMRGVLFTSCQQLTADLRSLGVHV